MHNLFAATVLFFTSKDGPQQRLIGQKIFKGGRLIEFHREILLLMGVVSAYGQNVASANHVS